jgi:hypothetical protein
VSLPVKRSGDLEIDVPRDAVNLLNFDDWIPFKADLPA